jgi:probable addiction module antidote protein
MASIAEKANLNRESLYRMLSKKGNPEIESIHVLLRAMGLRFAVEAEPQTSEAA